jgi:anti-sigma factor RsiW
MANEEMHGFDPEVVHRYFDGDLSPEEAEEAEAFLASSAEAQALLEHIAQSRSLLRSAAGEWEAQLSAAQSDALFDRITAGIDRAEPSAGATRPTRSDAPRQRPALEVIEGGRGRVFAGLGVALAAAAAVAFAVIGGPGTPAVPGGGASVASHVLGSEVIEVDFGRNTGTLFNVEGSAGQPLAVVWISDQVEKP